MSARPGETQRYILWWAPSRMCLHVYFVVTCLQFCAILQRTQSVKNSTIVKFLSPPPPPPPPPKKKQSLLIFIKRKSYIKGSSYVSLSIHVSILCLLLLADALLRGLNTINQLPAIPPPSDINAPPPEPHIEDDYVRVTLFVQTHRTSAVF